MHLLQKRDDAEHAYSIGERSVGVSLFAGTIWERLGGGSQLAPSRGVARARDTLVSIGLAVGHNSLRRESAAVVLRVLNTRTRLLKVPMDLLALAANLILVFCMRTSVPYKLGPCATAL